MEDAIKAQLAKMNRIIKEQDKIYAHLLPVHDPIKFERIEIDDIDKEEADAI